jgi:hypothetical protein
MMNKPWLKHLLAAICVIAVMVGMVVVGYNLSRPAPASPAANPLPRIDAEVIAPSRNDVDDEPGVQTGTIDVVETPYEGLTPETVDLLGAMTEADDPLDALVPAAADELPSGDDLGISLFEGADDPCAEDGAEDCPEGIRSAIFALYGSEPLIVRAMAEPPSYESDPYSEVVCPAAPESTTALTLGVATNKPATLLIDYWPSTSTRWGSETVSVEAPLDPLEEADWDAHTGDRDLLLQSYWVQHCVRLEGLDPDVSYIANIRTMPRDDEGSFSSTRFDFAVGGGERPATEVLPAGNGILYVTTYHERDVDARITARLLDLAEVAACEGDYDDWIEPVFGKEVSAVDFGWLRDNGYGEQFQRRSSMAYYVPEGSYLAVCVTQEKEDAPSWIEDNPLRSERFIVTSPDQTIPVVSIRGLIPGSGPDPDRVTISASTVEGQLCGAVFSPGSGGEYVNSDFTNAMLCDFTSRVGQALGTDANLVITTAAERGDSVNRGAFALNLASNVCIGTCPVLPADATYSLPLGARALSEGGVRIQVTWEQGRQNGATAWEIEELPGERVPDGERGGPRLDTNQALNASEALYGLPLDHVNLWTQLIPDRPVDYVATLIGDCVLDGTDALGYPTTTRLEGSTSGPVMLQFLDVCFGERYGLQVTMTDAEGLTTVYSSEPGTDVRWYRAAITTPLLVVPVDYSFDIETYGTASSQWIVDYVELWIEGRVVAELIPAGTCIGAGRLESAATDVTAAFGSMADVEIRISAFSADGTNRLQPDGTVIAECTDQLTTRPLLQRIAFDMSTQGFHMDPYETIHTIAGTLRFDVNLYIKRVLR